MSQPPPIVSIVVPAYRAAPFIGEALASLQAQSVREWEALVVDDGDPAIPAAVAPFLTDPRFRLLRTPHGGASAARNRAIARARAPLLAMLDGDDRYRPDYLARMLARIQADERLGFVTSDALLFGPPQFDGKLFSSLEPQDGEVTLERVLRCRFKVFGSVTARRAAVAAVGGYDEELRAAEDMDLWIRMLAAGWRAARVDAPLVEYRRHSASLSADTMSIARSVVQMYEKCVALLAGRPEAAAASEMLVDALQRLKCEQGFALVGQDRIGEAVPMLRASDLAQRSFKWKVALTAFALVPPLARPVLRSYMRQHPFARPAGAGGPDQHAT
jgi:GT2 family glycosyltransferase